MPPARKKRLGVGAVVSCFARYVEPKAEVRKKFVNTYGTKRLQNCRVIGEKIVRFRHKEVDVVVLNSDELMLDDTTFIEIYTAKNNVKIDTVGPEAGWFYVALEPQAAVQQAEEELQEFPEHVQNVINMTLIVDDDTLMQLGDLLEIDDDNAPAPENVPEHDNNEATFTATLGYNGTCYRRE